MRTRPAVDIQGLRAREARGEPLEEADRLLLQNTASGWIDCEARGLRHRPVIARELRFDRPGGRVAVYTPCARCPVTIHRVDVNPPVCCHTGRTESPEMHTVLGCAP